MLQVGLLFNICRVSTFRNTKLIVIFVMMFAERRSALSEFLAKPESGEALYPVTATILQGAKAHTAEVYYDAFHHLMRLKRATEKQWEKMDVLLVPTSPSIYSIDAVLKDPIKLNSNLGAYTNFVNLLNLCALAVPGKFRDDGLPSGVTLIAPSGYDKVLLEFGAKLHLPDFYGAVTSWQIVKPADANRVELFVLGAHMRGMPLNEQLTSRGGVFLKEVRHIPTVCDMKKVGVKTKN